MSTIMDSRTSRLAVKTAVKAAIRDRISRNLIRRSEREIQNWWERFIATGATYFDFPFVVEDFNPANNGNIELGAAALSLLGEYGYTISNQAVYVAPVSGSDSSGHGTSTAPYKTLEFLEGVLPILRDDIYVFFQESGPIEFWENAININSEGGRLIMTPESVLYRDIAGPYIVNAATGVGAAGPFGASLATDISLAAPAWVAQEHYANWILMLDGAAKDYVFPIFDNGTDYIRTGPNFMGVAPGDTFQIVMPPIELDCKFSRVSIKGATNSITPVAQGKNQLEPYIIMGGIEFIGKDVVNPFAIESCAAVMSFCNFRDIKTGSSSLPLIVSNAQLNAAEISVPGWQEIFDYSNNLYNVIVTGENGAIPVGTETAVNVLNSAAGGICTQSRVYAREGNCQTFGSQVGSWLISEGVHKLDHLFVDQPNWAAVDDACLVGNSNLIVLSMHVESAQRVLLLAGISQADLYWLQSNAGNITSNYAVQIQGSGAVIKNSANVSALGAIGAVDFPFDASVQAAWPGAGVMFDDTGHAFVKGLA